MPHLAQWRVNQYKRGANLSSYGKKASAARMAAMRRWKGTTYRGFKARSTRGPMKYRRHIRKHLYRGATRSVRYTAGIPGIQRPLGQSQFEHIVMTSQEDIRLSADSAATQRVTLQYALNTAKVSAQEYERVRLLANRFRQVRYTGTTIVVTCTDAYHQQFQQVTTTGTTQRVFTNNTTSFTPRLFYNLGYKHSITDLTNPSWPMNQKDTRHMHKHIGYAKRFKVPANFQRGYWSETNLIFPATKPASASPNTWVATQVPGSPVIDRSDINDEILLSADGLPQGFQMGQPVTDYIHEDVASIFYTISVYHHFVLRTPNQLT